MGRYISYRTITENPVKTFKFSGLELRHLSGPELRLGCINIEHSGPFWCRFIESNNGLTASLALRSARQYFFGLRGFKYFRVA